METTGEFFTSFNGAKLKIYKFGGSGPVLVIAHATGFNSLAYKNLASFLVSNFTVVGIDAEGHGQSEVTADGHLWSNYPRHIEYFIGRSDLNEVYGFGHSFGGAALLQVAAKNSGTFKEIVTYEPVIFPGPAASQPNYSSPITQLTLKRQFEFESREQAISNFTSKPPMNSFAPQVVADYIEGGTYVNQGGTLQLTCDRQFEASVYAHAQMAGIEAMLAAVRCPVTYLYGQNSKDFSFDFFDGIARSTPKARLSNVDSVGHFGPFEAPERIAKIVIDTLSINIPK